jgi:hydroxymethylglutaryl-CoA synthase
MGAIGIVSAGAYIPRYRLSGKTLAAVWGASAGGERAVANYDEDSLTMAVEASLNALAGHDPRQVDGCLFASTSAPYLEKSSATLLATVADLGPHVVTADLGGSLRCGTTALVLAANMVRAESARRVLVAAADMRPVAPGTPEELTLGDGAAALLVGSEGVIVSVEGTCSVSREFSDVWRTAEDRYLNILPDMTFVKGHGLDKHIREAVEGVLATSGRRREDIAKAVVYAPDARTRGALLRELKLPERAAPKEPVIERTGNAGSASCLLELVSVLEECRPGDLILVVSYGNGAEALLLRCTDHLAKVGIHRPVSLQVAAGKPLAHYGKLLNFRRHVQTEVVRAFSSVPTMVREEKQDLRLYGQKCQDCGAVSYPRRHLCWQCSSARLADHRMSRRGRVFTFTRDHLMPSPDPPTVMIAADLEGGGRFYGQLTDCDPASVTFEAPVELCFRRIHEGDNLVNYFWKFRPLT